MYVSDVNNHRVMRWIEDAKEDVVVVDGQGHGNGVIQFYYPHGNKKPLSYTIKIDQRERIFLINTEIFVIMRDRFFTFKCHSIAIELPLTKSIIFKKGFILTF
jgi:pheromone shutdown protein TraB